MTRLREALRRRPYEIYLLVVLAVANAALLLVMAVRVA